MYGNTTYLPIITGCAILLLIATHFVLQHTMYPDDATVLVEQPITTSTAKDVSAKKPVIAATPVVLVQPPKIAETPPPIITPPVKPEGAIQQKDGGIVRAGCEDIKDSVILRKCKQERALASYIYTIAPGAIITKGFCLPGTSFDDPKNWNQCTDLSDFETDTVHEIKNILTKIISHCDEYGISDCGIVITGGSEYGHKGEITHPDGSIECIDKQSHCGGKKIDLRLTQGLQSLVELNFEPIEIRDFDGAQQWRDNDTGNIYALEPTHWDILVP